MTNEGCDVMKDGRTDGRMSGTGQKWGNACSVGPERKIRERGAMSW